MTLVICIAAILGGGLALHGIAFLVAALIAITAKPPTPAPDPAAEDLSDHPITVLIPARDEGEHTVRAIRSVLDQDHRGPLRVILLLEDRADSSLPFLAAAFGCASFEGHAAETRAGDPAAELVELLRAPGRLAQVAFLGVGSKSKKINAMLPRVENPHLALLDCDHQAHPAWLRTSLQILRREGAAIVQSRRHPLSAHGFFQLWDSLHQHIGCEVMNLAFTRLRLPVFFTGTTAVMETSVLTEHPLRPCLTEDTDLCYRLLLGGATLAYNPHAGSDEELSPDHASFLARRRRWAGGHTEVFLRALPGILSPKTPLSLAGRAQLLFHGLHYLVALPVFVLHTILGALVLDRLSDFSLCAAGAAALILANLLSRRQKTRGLRARASEMVVLFAWLFPTLVLAMNLGRAAFENDLSLAALPLPGVLQLAGLFGFVAPLLLLFVGLVRFRQASFGTLLTVGLTYPLAFILDVSAVLIGIADFLGSREIWRPIARAEAPDTLVLPGPGAPRAAVDIKGSWRLRILLARSLDSLDQAMRPLLRPSRSIPLASLLGLFALGVLWAPADEIPLADRACHLLAQDGEPWILPAARGAEHCQLQAGTSRRAKRTGTFPLAWEDDLRSIDDTTWDRLDSTFFCNEAHFSPENLEPLPGGGLALRIDAKPKGDRKFRAGSIATKDRKDANFLYGRFETVMKPSKVSGVVSAFFLYRFDPWQEIDAEFVGKDTSKILLNVYYNPGEKGDLYNYGFRGTPVLVDLGFDASEAFHRYAIEWDPEGIRWFVDGELIHARTRGRPTPIPHLPMRFHVSAWPICSEELAGPFDPADLPTTTELRSVRISTWAPTTSMKIATFFRELISPDTPSGWREQARWVQPGR